MHESRTRSSCDADQPDAARLGVAGTFATLAGFEALYTLGAALCMLELSGLGKALSARSLLLALCMSVASSVSIFLIDRAKLRDAWLDPADAASKPLRFAFIVRYAGRIRALAITSVVAATACGWMLHPIAAVLPTLAFFGGVLYAAGPKGQRPRPKDVFLFKNVYTGAGIAGLGASAALAAWLAETEGNLGLRALQTAAGPLLGATVFVLVRVLADAVLSDVDDVASDRHFGTATLATRFSAGDAVGVGLALRSGAAAIPLLLPFGPVEPRLVWACVLVLTTVALHLVRPSRWRDTIDGAFALEAALVMVVLLLLN